MADDRMRNQDLDKNMGGAGKDQDNFGQQTPGRGQQDDLKTGQRGAGQGQQGQQGQNEPGNMEDDFGTSGNKGQGQGGGQNRGNI